MDKKVFFWILILCTMSIKNLQAQYVEWAFNTVSGTSVVHGMDMDSDGNMYTTGHFYSGIVIEETRYDSGFYLAKYNADGEPIWSQVAGKGNTRGLDVAIDNAGNSYVTGFFQTDITFGTGAGTVTLTTLTHYQAGFIAKYDVQGNFIWAKKVGGDGNNEGLKEIEIDDAGNFYVSGIVKNKPYVAKYNSINGDLIWFRDDVNPTDISTDGTHLYLTGTFYTTLVLDGITIVSDSGHTNVFYAKMNNGNATISYLKKASIRTSNSIRLANDNQGNGYILGYGFNDESSFAGISLPVNNETNNIFIAKYDSSGNELWAQQANGLGDPGPSATDIVADEYGVYTTGYFHTQLDFGNGQVITGKNTSIKLFKSFVAKYNSNGRLQWVRPSAGVSFDEPYRIDTDGKGKVTIAGRTGAKATYECIELAYASSSYWGLNVRYFDATHPLAGTLPPNAGQKPAPANPITGIREVCAGSQGVVYTTTPIPNVTSYRWEVPEGATIVSGIGSDSITVDFSLTTTGGEIKVKGVNQYCDSEPATLVVQVTSPPKGDGVISGLQQVTPGQMEVRYTLQGMNQAYKYEWTLSNGVTPTNGSTATINNYIDVNFPSDSGVSIIAVKGINDCGESETFELEVSYKAFSIQGGIEDENGSPIIDTRLILTNSTANTETRTKAQGKYQFTNLQNDTYSLEPVSDEIMVSPCIDFFDWIELINYKNGFIELDSSYKKIAADIDNDNRIGDGDIDLLMNVINDPGNYSIPNTYKFIPAEFSDFKFTRKETIIDMVKITWIEIGAYPESLEYTPLVKEELNQDFIGVRTGSLNQCF